MKLTRRFLALLLAFSMCFSMVSPAFASEVETVAETEAEAVVIETEAAEVVETEAAPETEAPETEAPVVTDAVVETEEVIETEAVVETEEVIETEAVLETAAVIEEVSIEDVDGTVEAPTVLTELGWHDVSLAEANEVCYFTYIAEGDGTATFYLADLPEGVTGDLDVTIGDVTKNLYVDGIDNNGYELTVEVAAGDELTIAVTADAAAEFSLVGSFAYAQGTEQNPIALDAEFEWNEANTEATATVTAPVGTTYYSVFGSGMMLYVNGEFYVELIAQGIGRVPAVFPITNEGEAEEVFVLTVSYPAGSQMNPDELVEGENIANVEEGSQGYYYTYTAADNGMVTITFAAEPGWSYVINNLTAGTYGDTQWNDSDPVVNPAEVIVNKGEELQVIVSTYDAEAPWNAPAGNVAVTVAFEANLGTKSNPEMVQFDMNEDYSEGTATVTIPANSEAYYFQTYNVGGMALYVNGELDQILPSAMGRAPVVFALSNDTDEDLEVDLSVAYPDGHQMKPAVLAEGKTTVAVAEASQGYYFTYTAVERGTVTLTISAEPGWSYVVNNLTAGVYGDTQWSDSDPVVNPAEIAVNKGDELQIIANTYDAAKPWTAPAGNVTVDVAFEAALGTEMNPIYPEWEMDENNEINYTTTVPANTTNHYCAYGINGMLMSINGGEPTEMVAQGIGMVPVYFSIANDTDANAEYILHLEYPTGNSMNPAELLVFVEGESLEDLEGQNIATVKEGNWDGYNYSWIAPADGQLTITMSNGKAGWFYVINNMTTYAYGDNHFSCNGDAASETIDVTAGDEIAIVINSCGASEYDVTPAGDVYFNAYFAEVVGTEINPYLPEWSWNDAWTDGTVTVTVPAGVETYYIGLTNQAPMMLSINGVEAEMVYGGYPPVPFELAGNAEEDTVYELHLYFPEGTNDNPTDIEAGSYSAELEENSEGTYYSFTAPDRGTVTVTFTSETWKYQIDHPSAYSYPSGNHTEDPSAAVQVLEVNKGDELTIYVNTYAPDVPYVDEQGNEYPNLMMPSAPPAGTVSFTVDFAAAEGTESNPIYPTFEWNDAQTEAYAYVMAPVGTSYYGVYASGMYMTANGGEPFAVNGSRWAPYIFTITNDGEEEALYELHMYYLPGSMSNPAEMVLGKKNSAQIEAGNNQGYWFNWTATGNGVLEVTMNTGKNWTYQVMNDTTYASSDTHWSDESPVVKKEYLAVNKGDIVKIMVNTYDPADMWNNPAGKIEFTPKLIVSYDDTLLAGKNVTLKVLDPTTGKALAANKYTWTLTYAVGTEVPAEVATLKSGKLTAAKTVAEETIVIATASNEAGEKHVFTVTIWPAATSVTIKNNGEAVDSKTTLTLITNKSETWPVLSAEVAPNSALNAVTWKSSNTKVADIDENGNVYPVGNKGNVTFTATAADGSGKKATVKIVVTTEVTSIDITSKTGFNTVGAGKSLTLIATTNKDAVNQKVEWSISEGAEYATIKAGKLTANKGLTEIHEVTVVATAMDGSGVTGTFAAIVLPIASTVEITGLPEGNTFDMNTWWPEFYLGADVLDAEGNFIDNNVTWKSSSDKIATISEDGTVFCVKPGTVTFTATANDGSGKKASVKVTIVKSPTEVQLPSRVVVAAGKTADLSKTEVLEADASNKKLTWSFDDPDAAAALGVKVSNGKVSTNAKLITEPVELSLTATAVLGGASDTTIIMIYPATKSVSIMSNGAAVGKSVDLNSGDSIVLYAENEPVNAAGRYSWTSSNENIATVEYNPDGSVTVKVHALKTSKAVITATAVDGTNKKASVTLNVVADVDALGLDGAVVLSGKSVKMSSNLFFLDWNSEYEYYDVVTPVSKTVTWTLSLADYSDGTGEPTFIPCENNECYAGTLNAKTGVFTAAKVTEAAYCFVTATYIDEDGNEIVSNGAQITVTPVALKGIDIIGCEGAWNETVAAKITGKTVSTTTGRYVLDVKPTNPEGDPVHYMWWIDLSDWENFTTEWEEILVEEYDEEGNLLYSYTNNVPVIVPVDDGDPYGTVKVTIIADGGVTKKASATIKFMEPTAE